jgi:hypothetical protein
VCFLIGAHVGCYGVADRIACEEAAAHLAECCPGFNPEDARCGSSDTTENDISRDEAPCIIYQECADLVAYGVCNGPFFLNCH